MRKESIEHIEEGTSKSFSNGEWMVRVANLEDRFTLDFYRNYNSIKVLESDSIEDAYQLVNGWLE